MSQMEYKTVTVRGALFNVAEALNKKYAPHGWRLVHPREGDNYTLCILERPVGYEETLEAEQPLHVVTQQRLEQALYILNNMVTETVNCDFVTSRRSASSFILDMAENGVHGDNHV